MKKQRLIAYAGAEDKEWAVVTQIRELLGDDAAEELATICGGERIRLPSPAKLTPEHPLALRLGYQLARRIVDTISPATGVSSFYVPKLLPIRLSRLLREDGLTSREIAQRLMISQRTVFRYRQRFKEQKIQVGEPSRPRSPPLTKQAERGRQIVETLLAEGHSPSQIRDILNVPGEVILTIRAHLHKEGKS
ncbi:helix-turn-helix domain-containing protein [Gellertiella hungarica]|uniref:Homeodomain-like domain-containing protein n=1 Tax=Gellertiella hungarica TaxID=1572859 RepID=A0A7W6NL95_9HYPH|nr:helix-turn-helix domain-containing protein [Gellertiella hungarica]MBB4065693.1 hypothetical protein [Gellertiella hungarica]